MPVEQRRTETRRHAGAADVLVTTPGTIRAPVARSSLATAYYGAVVLTLVYCFAFVDRQIFNLLVAPIKRDFGVSDLQIGVLLGPAFILTYVAVGLPAGWCADRFDRSRLILGAGLLWSLGTAGAAFAHSYTGLFASRLLVGAAEAFLFPAGISFLADLFDRRSLPIATSIFIAAPQLGGGLALLGGGLLLGATEHLDSVAVPLLGTIRGWQVTLLAVGVVGLIPVLLVATVPDHGRRRAMPGAAPGDGDVQYGFVEGTAYMLKRWRFYFAFFVGIGCSSLVMLTVSAWAPTYLARTFHLDPSAIGTRYGTLVLVFGLLGNITSPLINKAVGRWTRDPTMQTVRLGPFLLIGFACLLMLVRSEAAALVCLALLIFSCSFPLSMASTSLQIAAPPRLRGIASAYYFVIGSLIGYGVGPTAVPLVTEKILHDPQKIGVAIGAIAALFGLLAALLLSIAVGGFRRERDAARKQETGD